MNYMLPVWMYRAGSAPENSIRKHGARWVEMIDDPQRADGRAFLESEPDQTIQ